MKPRNKVVLVWPHQHPTINGYPVFWADADFVRVLTRHISSGFPDVVWSISNRYGGSLDFILHSDAKPELAKYECWNAKRCCIEIDKNRLEDWKIQAINAAFAEAVRETGVVVEVRAEAERWEALDRGWLPSTQIREVQTECCGALLCELGKTTEDVHGF